MLAMPDSAYVADERTSLTAILDEQRALVLWKLENIDETAASASPVPSNASLLGAVKHLAWIERDFFIGDVAGLDINASWQDRDPGGDWRIDPGDTVASVSHTYASAVAEADSLDSRRPLL